MLALRDHHLDKAWSVAFDLLNGRSTLGDVRKEITDARMPALQARVDGMLRQFSSLEEPINEARLEALFQALARDGDGRVDFERFQELLCHELAGIVLTAHPTFSLSAPATATALQMLSGGAVGAQPNGAGSSTAASITVHREAAPTLQEELDSSTAAIRNLRRAVRRVLRVAIGVAARAYPEQYRAIKPSVITLATWVGFDLDGRTDIGWSKSLSCRYQLALAGLDELTTSLSGLRARHRESSAQVAAQLDVIGRALSTFTECFRIGLEALGRESELNVRLGRLNRLALEKRSLKQDAIGAIDVALEEAIEGAASEELCKDLIVLRSEWLSSGLALARVHFRLNSVQLHNAIRPELSMKGAPGRSASRRHYLAEVSRLLDSVSAVNVHYGTVAREQTTAKRVFMLAAQFQKHFDGRTPIRLLIAESDTPFTLLAALYYARLFGVEALVEISPLFETADGLHHGDRVISELIDNPHFLAYIRAQRRFCVQLGFSDSGRYIGQPAASLAIERFKLRLIRLWEARGLQDVQLLIFDTHGESIGRGAHPASLEDRFLYTHSGEVRRHLDELAAPHKHEVSFQGGEGYLWFASERTALAVVTEFVAARLHHYRQSKDVLYQRSGWGLDFFLTLKDYQERLTKHGGYLELINAIGRSLLYATGSRAMQRQSGGRAANVITDIAQLRAIPNNAIVQQLAYFVNACAGLGQATQASPEAFLAVLESSERLRRLMSLALTARERSDITMFEAYVQLMSPGYWLDRTHQSLERDWNKTLRRVSRVLEGTFNHDAMASFVRTLRQDAAHLDDVLEQRHLRGTSSSADALTRLHTLRLAVIQFVYIKAMEIPQFSSRLEISLGDLIEQLLHLDVPDTVATLRRIFPAQEVVDDTEVYAERDTYVATAPSGYAAEHRQIFDPIEDAYALILEMSALIAMHVGAYG
jgi:phosphoenolpyruvate carboxylase